MAKRKENPTWNNYGRSGLAGHMEWREMCTNRAKECQLKAQQARDPNVQTLYQALAREWQDLADLPDGRIAGVDQSEKKRR
jgi:hypothetical protein